jgi:hypothetical protein
MIDERLLQRMQRSIFGKALDGDDVSAVLHDGQRQAGIDPSPSTRTVQAPHWP